MRDAQQQSLARDLLFGVLALQLGLVRAEQVVEAGAAWAADRSKGPGARLREQLEAAGRDTTLVERLLETAVQSQDGDAERALASFGGEQVVLRSFGGSVSWQGEDVEPTLPSRVREDEAEAPELQSLQVTEEQPGRYAYRIPEDRSPTEDPRQAVMGRGGIGRILLAYDSHLGRELAMKELLPARDRGQSTPAPSPRSSSAKLGRFLREARITGQLEHPNIVPVYELGQRDDGSLYYTMKVVRGHTLAAALKACRDLSDRLSLLNHFVDLCQAAAFAHSRGVIHRDIKPENVMLGAFGETVLVDWGLAKAIGAAQDPADTLPVELVSDEVEVDAGQTLVGTAVGTPAYMSPEQAEGRVDDIDARSDIWSLGAVLYEILTGRRPFEGVHPFEVIGKILSQDHVSARQACIDAPPELCILADKALSREPADRFQGARELAQEVERFLAGGQVALYAYSPWENLKRYAAGHKAVLSVAAITLLVLLVLAPTVTLRLLAERDRAQAAERAARQQRATAQLEGARTALLRGLPLEARSKLRSALEIQDTPAGRSFLQELAGEVLMAQINMTAQGYRVAFSPVGLRLATGSEMGQIYLADQAEMDARVLRGQKGRVSDLSFSPDGKRLASVGHGGLLQVLGLEGNRTRLERDIPVPVARTVSFSPDGHTLVTGGGDGRIRFFDSASGMAQGSIQAHDDEVVDLVFDPSGRRLASASYDGTIALWDVETRGKQRVLRGHEGRVYCLDFSPDGARLVSGGMDGSVRLWSTMTGEAERILTWHEDRVYAVAWQNDGPLIASASREILLHDSVTGRELGSPGRHEDYVGGLDFSRDGSLLASSAWDGRFRIWSTVGVRPRSHEGHSAGTSFSAFSPDGSLVASASMDHSIRLWRRDSAEVVKVLEAGGQPVYQLAFSPDGRWLIAGGQEETLRIWDWKRGRSRKLVGHDGPAVAVAIRPDGAQVASGSWDGRVGLWSFPEGKLERMLTGHSQRIYNVVYSPDGRLVASGSSDQTICIHDSRSGELVKVLKGHTSQVYGLSFSPDGSWLVSAGSGGGVFIWRVEDWQSRSLAKMQSRAHYLSFSPDGGHLALALANGHIRMWRFDSQVGAASGSSDRRAHSAEVNDVQFSADGAYLASTGDDDSLRLWRVDGDELRPAWKGGLVLSDASGHLHWSTHRGWFKDLDGEKRGPLPAAYDWQRAVEQSRLAEASPDGNLLCLVDGTRRLSIWDRAGDKRLLRETLAGAQQILALDNGCALLFDGGLRLVSRDGQSSFLAEQVRTIGREQDGGLYALSGTRMLRFEARGKPRQGRNLPPGVNRVLQMDTGLLLGFADGGLEFHGPGGEVMRLTDLPTHGVTCLLAGPANMVMAGFADGQVGMWELPSGRRSIKAQLHGQIQGLRMGRESMVALSALGQERRWNFSIFRLGHCAMLRKAWRLLPTVWENGAPVLKGPSPDHPCLEDH